MRRQLLEALGREALRLGHSVQYVGAMELISTLAKAQAQHALEARLTQDAKTRLRINRCAEGGAYDGPGYLRLEPNAAYPFFQLISRCYQSGSVLITSNRPVMDWGEMFGDQVIATAILDRLLHHSHALTIRGDSYRLREKRRRCRSQHQQHNTHQGNNDPRAAVRPHQARTTDHAEGQQLESWVGRLRSQAWSVGVPWIITVA